MKWSTFETGTAQRQGQSFLCNDVQFVDLIKVV